MNNYYRITGYCEQEDFCFIIDSNEAFDKLWQFSSFLIQRGFIVLEVGNNSKFLDGNIARIDVDTEKMVLRANAKGKPEYINKTVDDITYRAVKVADKVYIPDRNKIL